MHVPSRGKLTVIAILACLAAIAAVAPANGQLNFVPGPEDAWAYYTGPSGHPGDENWYPTSIAEFCPTANPNVVFQGYVDYTLPKIHPQFYGGPNVNEYGVYHIFCTHAFVENDIVIPVTYGGDDGCALFLDGVFVSGTGFNQPNPANLSLRANTWHTVILAGNNAMGPWVFGLVNLLNNKSLQETPGGVRIRASEHCIPEPSGLSALGVGLLTLFGVALRPRIRFRR